MGNLKRLCIYRSWLDLLQVSVVYCSSLAYSNIMAEWLSTAKHNRVYLAEEPFLHGSLIRSGRLKSFQHLHVSLLQVRMCGAILMGT